MRNRRFPLLLLLCLTVSACNTQNDVPIWPSAPVTIIRDSWGVPHIQADNLEDAVFGQGYAQLEDRLLQWDLMRRTARGSQAELLGEDALAMDKLVRTIGIERSARKALARIKNSYPSVYRFLQAYCAGANRYLDRLAAGEVTPPADLLALDATYLPPPCTPLDPIVVGHAAMFSLSSQIETDLLIAAMEKLLDPETLARYTDYAPLVTAWTMVDPSKDSMQPLSNVSKKQMYQALQRWQDIWKSLRARIGPSRSNNWVVAGDRSVGGGAMLASDPHGGIPVPTNFHEIHLMTPEANIYGIAVIGAPMVHMGHNRKTAWAFTNYMSDVGDLYAEKPVDNAWSKVEFLGRQVELVSYSEIIKVRPKNGTVADAVEETLTINVVPHHGPLLNDVLPDPLPLLFADTPISYRWVGDQATREAVALSRLATLADWDGFLSAMKFFDVGAQNAVFADSRGNIGYIAPGLFPLRRWDTTAWPPIGPLPGTGDFEWNGYRSFADLPRLYNPGWGFIGTANNDPNGPDNDYLAYMYDYGFRAGRIRSVLSSDVAKGKVNLDDMARLQTDVEVGPAALLVPGFVDAVSELTPGAQKSALLPLSNLLAGWNRQGDVNSSAAALFHMAVVRLISDFVARPLPGFVRPLLLGGTQISLRALVKAVRTRDPLIFPEGSAAAFRSALRTARDDLNRFFATTSPTQWRWGAMHLRHLKNPVGSYLGDDRFAVGPAEIPGGFATVNRSDFAYLGEDGPLPLPWEAVDGADMRFLVALDKGRWETRMVMPAGSSGDPASPHYQDQFPLWTQGHYRRALYTAEEVASDSRSVTVLQPPGL